MSKSDALAQKFGANLAQTVGMRAGGIPPLAGPEAPDKYAGAVKARTFAEMPVGAIDCNLQVRTEFDDEDLARLAESIKRFGQLAPIRVRHDPASNRWVVLVGERRLRACKLAGIDRVRVEFVERDMTEADVLAEQVVENAVRADLQPVEQSRAYRRLMDMNGWTAQQLAETLGVEPTAVYRSLGLLRLPEDVAARVDSGEIRPTAAYEISKLQIADEQRALADEVVAGNLDHAATAAEVKRRQSARAGGKGRGAKARKATSRVLKTSIGYRITVEHRRGIEPASLVVALREALDQAQAELAKDDQTAA